MISIAQEALEENLYRAMLKPDIRVKLAEYEMQSPAELADIFTRGLMSSWIGNEIRRLEALFPNTPIDAKAAFKVAILRLINESRIRENP